MNLLITGAWNGAQKYMQALRERGHSVCFMQQETDALPCEAAWVDGIVGNGIFLHHPIQDFVNLKYIQLTSAGFDRVPMEYAEKKHIAVYNARGVYSVPMAEFAVAGVLTLYKQMRFLAEHQKAHVWEKHRDLRELSGKTVCIVGCGSVGTACAKRFRAFDCRIIGIDLFPKQDKQYDTMLPLSDLDHALPQADVVVLTLPLTAETTHLFDAERLAQLSHDAVLVNIARGAIVDTAALTAALPNLGGAVLDVFEEEPLPADSPLWNAENVVITPHNSFVGEGNPARLDTLIMDHLTEWNSDNR